MIAICRYLPYKKGPGTIVYSIINAGTKAIQLCVYQYIEDIIEASAHDIEYLGFLYFVC